MCLAFRGQASWCPTGPTPWWTSPQPEQQVREKGLWPTWMQNSLELGTKGLSTRAPAEPTFMKKTHRLPHTPLTVGPSTEARVTAVVEAEGPHGRERNRVRVGPRALLTGPSPTPHLLLLLFTPESHPGDTWLQCGPSPPERHAPTCCWGRSRASQSSVGWNDPVDSPV